MDGEPQAPRTTLDLSDYLRVIRRRWRLIALITVLAGVLGFGLARLQTPRYEARARVLLDTGYSRTILFTNDLTIPNVDDQVTTEFDLMRSQSVQQSIAKELGYEPDVEIVADTTTDKDQRTRAISVIGKASTGGTAARQANDFAQTYVKVRRALISQDLKASIAENEATLERLDERTAASLKELEALEREVEAETDPDKKRVLEVRLERLRRAIDPAAVDARQQDINRRTDVLSGALSNNEAQSIFRLNMVEPPEAPVAPRPVRQAIIFTLIGLGVALIAAFMRDYYDDTIRTKEELERAASGLPVVGLIPTVSTWRHRDEAVLETARFPTSPTSEAYRSLRTALDFMAIEHKLSVIHITSSVQGEGKTTTAANLAVTMASAGKRVVVVDCDVRRPRLHQFFGLSNEVGFTSVIIGDDTLQGALQRVAQQPNLLLLPAGPTPPNPAELLSSGAAKALLTSAGAVADHVIVDSPPLLPVADAAILSGYADSTVLVAASGRTTRRVLHRSLELLDQVNAPLEGIVFNNVSLHDSYGYGYGYGYVPYGTKDDSGVKAR